jgi:glycosyltransferase involved in cell wall biosynthesis
MGVPDVGNERRDVPLVTMVLPVRNEAAHIEQVLADVLAQEPPDGDFEVLVVDGRSTDATRERVEGVAAKDARVRLLDNPDRLSSAARAIGAEAARGRYVAYVDGHCRLPSRTLLRDMVALFERSGADCLARPQPLVPSGNGLRARAIAAARTSPFGHSTASEIYGGKEGPVSPVSSGAMYRREVFEEVGSFDGTFDACEDVEFNWRVEQAGLLTWTSPKLAVHYEPRSTYGGLFKQMVRYGLGRARLHLKHRASFSWESLVPAAFVLGIPCLVAAPWLPLGLACIVVALWALYALLAVGAGIVSAAKAGWRLLPLILVAFPVIHLGMGLGYIRGRVGG